MIKLRDLLTEGSKFDDVFKDYGFDVEKKSGGLTYWAHYGSDISGHKNSYIRGELSGWTDGKKSAVGDDRGRQSFSNPKAMAKWFEKNFKMKKESVNEGNLPSNIQKWIKDRGPKPSKDVKMIGKWIKKLTGREISGGVAIGKNYNTLVLDIEYEDAAIYYDTTSGDIKLYNKKIRNFNDFKKVFQANESVNEAYPWHKLDMTPKEEDFMDDLEYELEKIFPGKDKKINDFIVSVFDAYDQPQNDISDIVRGGGEAKLVKHAKRTGLKPLQRAI